MLVLSRKTGQQIIMVLPSHELITIKLTKFAFGGASLGIEAPRSVKVYREEVYNLLGLVGKSEEESE
jgi:carbon storage regulator CsrA